MNKKPWTKKLVQQHAQAAVAIEVYTLPFYFTVLSSIKPLNAEVIPPIYPKIYNQILSVAIEEMLHLQLAANLCIALGTTPKFRTPNYTIPVDLLKPNDPATKDKGALNARLGPFNKTALDTMLDIETPAEFEVTDPLTPQASYNSIGQLYAALKEGITQLKDSFTWPAGHQQDQFTTFTLVSKITSFDLAIEAINTICEQGEGLAQTPIPKAPFTPSQFPIPSKYQLNLKAWGAPNPDPSPDNGFSHFGRFISIQNAVKSGYPPVFSGFDSPTDPAALALSGNFAKFITGINNTWNTGAAFDSAGVMPKLLANATTCWTMGVIPYWGKP